MAEFLAENNPCGQNLLSIVSMGNAIIAEILRLKDYIPDIYRLETKADQQKYGEIILDFSYLKFSEVQDKKIEDNAELSELDKELRENYIDLITRFYLAFESTHQYATDLKQFIDDLNEGYFIQQTIESVLQDNEGKQLMCEALFLFGVMLLILDLHIPGIIRERLLVSYYRYSAEKSHGESNIDDVCKLLRSTGFSNVPGSKRVPHYPENYFGRFIFDQTYIDMVIGRLRSDDIYNQLSIYPHPDHRSSALSNQAGMLYICLYFSPNILHNQLSQMREITDKFFSDNWIVSIYMGITVNLIDAWDHYKAAKQALLSVLETQTLKSLCTKRKNDLERILPKTYDILQEGLLNENFVIQNITKIINLIRDCNVNLKWYLLHTSNASLSSTGAQIFEFGGVIKKCKQIYDLILNEIGIKNLQIFELLLNTSQLELNIKDILKELLNEKLKRWNDYKNESYDRINELSNAFSLTSGIKLLTKIEGNEHLKLWFCDISKEIQNLTLDKPNQCGRKIIQLIQALDEVQEFHNLDTIMQVKQYLLETRKYLQLMIQLINIKEDILINLQLISDLSYAWKLIDINYTNLMQDNIKKQPTLVIKLRATFLKLSSALDIPLLRINQAHSDDLISVSKYYSNELANYIRKVLQIIPETMFDILSKIIKLQTEVIKEIPTRLDKMKLKEYAQLDERYMVAELTYSISVFTEGILMMKKTLVGVIELDPKQLLEDGIRKEIINNLSKTLHDGLTFNVKTNNRSQELEKKLESLFKAIDGYRRSFEYIQDYLSINGLKILQEELSRLINYNVEKECNKYLRNKIQDWQSSYQNTTIPIPNYPSVDTFSNNFIGRLAREILLCTDPKTTIYWDLKDVWYERKTQKEILDYRIFKKIRLTIGPTGLVGLDKLYSFMFITDLQQNIEKVHKNIVGDKQWLEILNQLTRELETHKIIQNPIKFYQNYTSKWTKVWPKILEWILDLGHKQILRKLIAFELNNSCKFHAKDLESALETFNRALLTELQEHQFDSTKPCPPKELFVELNPYLEYAGLYDPLKQIFITTKNSHYIPLFLFLFTISHSNKLQYSKNFNTLIAKKNNEPIDGIPMIYGILTVLQQFHYKLTDLYLEYICQYITSILESTLSVKQEWSADVEILIYFLEIFTRIAKISKSVLEDKLPEIILDEHEFLASLSKN